MTPLSTRYPFESSFTSLVDITICKDGRNTSPPKWDFEELNLMSAAIPVSRFMAVRCIIDDGLEGIDASCYSTRPRDYI